MNKKQKERKDKKREEKAHSRVLARRKELRDIKKKADEAAKMEKHFKIKEAPYKREAVTDDEKARKAQYVRERLEHNLKILEALEEEAKREEDARAAVKENLGGDTTSLREKMDKAWGDLSANEEISAVPPGLLDGSLEAWMGA